MLKGIDISNWQKNVDWKKLKEVDKIDFVIPRIGYGTTLDASFISFVNGAKSVDIPVPAVYIFSYATNLKEVGDEIDFVRKQLDKFVVPNARQTGTGKPFIVYYDFEYDTVDKAAAKGIKLGPSEACIHAKTFVSAMKNYGYDSGVYANIDYYKNWYTEDITKENFWLADWTGSPDYPCLIQQYTSSGKLVGINGNVDMNYWFNVNDVPDLKSTDEIAQEVIDGKWNLGNARKKMLTEAGYDYSVIQNRVNELIKERDYKVSVEKVAQEVIQGKWASGAERKQKLTDAGFNYSDVQNKVNELMKK